MPRIKKIVTTTEETGATILDPEGADEIEDQAEPGDEIAELIANLEGATRARVIIQRRPPGKASFVFCAEMSLEDFKASGIADISKRFGGGKYQLKFKDDDGKWAGSRSIDIDERVKGELDQSQSLDSNGNGKSELLFKELATKETGTMAMMMQMMQMQQAQAAQAMQQQSQQNAANLQLLTAAMATPKTNWKEIAAMLSPVTPIILEFIKGRSKDATLTAIETLAKAKELFATSDGDSGMESIIKSLGPLVAAKLSQQPQSPVQVDTGAPAQPAPLENPQLPPPDADNPEMIKMLVVRSVRGYYPMLLKAAQRDSDPGSYFDVMMDNLENSPAAAILALMEILQSETWAKDLFGVDPLPFPKWFDALRGHFLEWYADQQATPAEEKASEEAVTVAPKDPPTIAPKAPAAKK